MQAWIVHKFGGSSLADADKFRRVADILTERRDNRQAVVVSAMQGVTDELLALLELARQRNPAHEERLDALRERHARAADELLGDGETRQRFADRFDSDCTDIADVLRATFLLRRESQAIRDLVSGFGELWSAQLLAGLLAERWRDEAPSAPPVDWLDAREVLVVEAGELGPVVHWDRSAELLDQRLPRDFGGTVVVTGYVASDSDGVQTTLGRNGSDFSASIMGALLDASQINIWTDVAGVMSADPRLVPDATVIGSMSYDEAMELAYFGARVIHPATMAPAVDKGIPLYIRDSSAAHAPGTRIGEVGSSGDGAVKGITTIGGMALVNLEGAGMIGVPGTAWRLFGALREAGVSVVMISQGSSEHSICFAVHESLTGKVREVLRSAFAAELAQHQIQSIGITHGCSILAVVGDGMAGLPGVAAKVFASLGRAGVNVRAIAQGSSERNISTVIDSAEARRALRAVHAGFYLSPQTLSIGLIGPGSVGGVLLGQLAGQAQRLRHELNLDLRVRAVATSSRMLLAGSSVDLAAWGDDLGVNGVPLDLDVFVEHVQAEHLPHAVIIDCTASQDIAERYAGWLARGIHVVTPNKKANTASCAYYRELQEARRAGDARFLYETTVGAGLPIIQTLRDLRETGDRIERIEGILSGTLAYLFNRYDGEQPFSALVRQARELGYTEPDPRDDLSGMDVARKLVILGREMGQQLELSDIDLQSLVPEALLEGSAEEFLDGLARFDDHMAERLASAREAGELLRYVGRLEAGGKASVRLERVGTDHPFASLNLTDNIVQFETTRYCDNPLIVRGPGAGPAVTAGGVFADLLRLAAYLGAAL